jgi:hypothetical protein
MFPFHFLPPLIDQTWLAGDNTYISSLLCHHQIISFFFISSLLIDFEYAIWRYVSAISFSSICLFSFAAKFIVHKHRTQTQLMLWFEDENLEHQAWCCDSKNLENRVLRFEKTQNSAIWSCDLENLIDFEYAIWRYVSAI